MWPEPGNRLRTARRETTMHFDLAKLRRLMIGFWIVMIAAQSYLLYRKYDALTVCRGQLVQLNTLEAQLDRLDRLKAKLDGPKKK